MKVASPKTSSPAGGVGMAHAAYPDSADARDRWIVSRRPARRALDPMRPHAFLLEEERADSGEVLPVATVFLTNRECPWRCLMCDLWKNTLTESVPPGAIAAQIDCALAGMAKQCSAGFQPASPDDIPAASSSRRRRPSPDSPAGMPAPRQ